MGRAYHAVLQVCVPGNHAGFGCVNSFLFIFFNVHLQGRLADLELRHRRGKEEPEELEPQQRCAWLW